MMFFSFNIKLKDIKLPENLVSLMLDDLGLVVFYTENSNTLSSFTYEDNGSKIIHQKEWCKRIREEGWLKYPNRDVTVIKTSYALIKYGYEIIEKAYERTIVSL